MNVSEFMILPADCAVDTIPALGPIAVGTPLILTYSNGLPDGVIIRGLKVLTPAEILVDYCNLGLADATVPATVTIEYVALD